MNRINKNTKDNNIDNSTDNRNKKSTKYNDLEISSMNRISNNNKQDASNKEKNDSGYGNNKNTRETTKIEKSSTSRSTGANGKITEEITKITKTTKTTTLTSTETKTNKTIENESRFNRKRTGSEDNKLGITSESRTVRTGGIDSKNEKNIRSNSASKSKGGETKLQITIESKNNTIDNETVPFVKRVRRFKRTVESN